jgi:RNA-dependent RNA polymerase
VGFFFLEYLAHSLSGKRSLPSMLGGGDLDGEVFFLSQNYHLTLCNRDIYAIIQYPPLLNVLNWTPAEYPPVDTLELDRKCDINDICNFVVDYIDSDLLVSLYTARITSCQC